MSCVAAAARCLLLPLAAAPTHPPWPLSPSSHHPLTASPTHPPTHPLQLQVCAPVGPRPPRGIQQSGPAAAPGRARVRVLRQELPVRAAGGGAEALLGGPASPLLLDRCLACPCFAFGPPLPRRRLLDHTGRCRRQPAPTAHARALLDPRPAPPGARLATPASSTTRSCPPPPRCPSTRCPPATTPAWPATRQARAAARPCWDPCWACTASRAGRTRAWAWRARRRRALLAPSSWRRRSRVRWLGRGVVWGHGRRPEALAGPALL